MNKLEDVSDIRVFADDIYIRKKENDEYFLQKMNSELNFLNKSIYGNVLTFNIFKDKIIYYTKSDETYIVTKEFQVIKKIDLDLFNISSSFPNNSNNKYYIGNTEKNGFIIYDFENNKIHHTLFPERINRAAILINNSSYLLYQPGGTTIEKYNFPQELQWKTNISEIGASENWFDGKLKGEIRNIYLHEDKVIVLARGGIVAYNIETGKIIWENRKTLSGAYLIILENVGYFNNGLFVHIINLDTGEILNSYTEFKNFIINGEDYYPSGSELVFYDNLFWSSVNSSGKAIIVSLNPETFKYVWWQEIKGANHIEKPVFYKNKMFIRDIENVLHVFEKELKI